MDSSRRFLRGRCPRTAASGPAGWTGIIRTVKNGTGQSEPHAAVLCTRSMVYSFDEAVALVEIIKLIQGDAAYTKFDRIVFDTAPTGHTLRLLALPDFMDSFLGKIISMKAKFGNLMGQMKNMFGGDGADGAQDGKRLTYIAGSAPGPIRRPRAERPLSLTCSETQAWTRGTLTR